MDDSFTARNKNEEQPNNQLFDDYICKVRECIKKAKLNAANIQFFEDQELFD